MLTKEETVNYLNKKLQEADGRYAYIKGRSRVTNLVYRRLSLRLVDAKLEFRRTTRYEHLDANTSVNSTCTFDPAHIKDVTIGNEFGFPPVEGSPVLVAMITLSGNLARCRDDQPGQKMSLEGDYGVVRLPFLDAAPGNRTRMEKAIKHLRDLAKAEDDPFGN